ncbi:MULTISPECIES: UvrD-helicase domain-containing protein [Acidiphilium]|uniref:UvrD-helicase domain-containing protein n=1 Tax=Acidiphilium TaxID=522 RepID=UPI002590C9AD|nr:MULTISPECIES: UvrD-helicase domain-containing protein [Acidiphilium]HQT85077.1 AAA family ATPase [Acidiphilium rubrum]
MMIDVDDNHFDDAADETIRECLNVNKPRSFFLYAGAGSGKTRSLVNAVRFTCEEFGHQLGLVGQRIGVITYTNAACDEIRQRLEFDQRVEVKTIHAFAWSLVEGYNTDIKNWLSSNLKAEIAELEAQQAKGRAGTKAASDRSRSIESKQRRIESFGEIRRFIYSPTGDNRTRDSLNHSEVIQMVSDFLLTKPGLRRLLVSRYPVLLIDESQDTNRHLMDALLHVQSLHVSTFCLGLCGDTMQRIYADGKVGLAEAIPEGWARPEKRMNHRCPGRVIKLINDVRAADDGQQQKGRSDKPEGTVRLFVLAEATPDKFGAETRIAARMAQLTGDEAWKGGTAAVKTLTLEHHMAARRFGFDGFFEALYPIDRLRTGLLDGSLPGISFFTKEVLPLVNAMRVGDRFRAAAIVRKNSPLLDRKRLEQAADQQLELLGAARAAAESLYALFIADSQPTLVQVLRNVAVSGLFAIPDSLEPFAAENEAKPVADDDDDDVKSEVGAWRTALNTPFDQMRRYESYTSGVSPFGTHQGVKGLEFPRVMVVISDDEARGFLFNYEKLFGVKEKSKADFENEAAGRETTIDRTRRLFYVICSRAEESLAIVYYSAEPDIMRQTVVQRGWFTAEEVEIAV